MNTMTGGSRRWATSLFSALLVLALAQSAAAQTAVLRQIRPKGDPAKCFARITGGFSLAPCPIKARVVFPDSGPIALGTECVAVQLAVAGSDPWKSGTRLQAVPCSDPRVAKNRKTWRYEGELLKAASPPDPNKPKCISIEALVGAMRAVIKDCGELGVTRWTLEPPLPTR